MSRKLKQYCSIIQSISTKQTITSHFSSLNIKQNTTTYDFGNPGHGLRQQDTTIWPW